MTELKEEQIKEELKNLNKVGQEYFQKGNTQFINGYRRALRFTLGWEESLTKME